MMSDFNVNELSLLKQLTDTKTLDSTQGQSSAQQKLFKMLSQSEDLLKVQLSNSSVNKTKNIAYSGATSTTNAKFQIKQLQSEIKTINSQIYQQTKLMKLKQIQLLQAQNKQQYLSDNLEKNNDKFTIVIDSVEKLTENLETNMKEQQQDFVMEVIAGYNQEKDGDFDKFLQKQLQGFFPNSSISAALNQLTGVSTQMMVSLASLNLQLKSANSTADKLQSDISTLNLSLTALNTSSLAKSVQIKKLQQQIKNPALQYVNRTEYAIARYNNLNLTQQMQDGFSRYVFLMDNSNQYHIFDRMSQNNMLMPITATMSTPSYWQNSIFYDNSFQNNLFGIDMSTFKAGTGTQTMAYMDAFGQMNTISASYDYMPLSLDIDYNNRLEFANNNTLFDIDGDGRLDFVRDVKDAVLVFDKDGDGISGANGSETFGKYTDLNGDGIADGYNNGFEALSAFAKQVFGEDTEYLDAEKIKFLEENYGLKLKLGGYNGKTASLSSYGQTFIDLAPSQIRNSNNRFNTGGRFSNSQIYNSSNGLYSEGSSLVGEVNQLSVLNQNYGNRYFRHSSFNNFLSNKIAYNFAQNFMSSPYNVFNFASFGFGNNFSCAMMSPYNMQQMLFNTPIINMGMISPLYSMQMGFNPVNTVLSAFQQPIVTNKLLDNIQATLGLNAKTENTQAGNTQPENTAVNNPVENTEVAQNVENATQDKVEDTAKETDATAEAAQENAEDKANQTVAEKKLTLTDEVDLNILKGMEVIKEAKERLKEYNA